MSEPMGLWDELAAKASRTVDDAAPAARDVWDELKQRTDFAAYRPKAIDTLVTQQLQNRWGQPYFVIKNPDTLHYLRLEPEDHFLLEQMTGENTVRELVMAYYREFKAFALNRITGLLAELKEGGFLDEPSSHVFESLKQSIRRRRWGYWAKRLFAAFLERPFALSGLDGFVGRTYRAFLWPLFSRPAALAYTILAVVGLVLFAGHFTSGAFDLFKLGESYELGILALLLINVFVILLHEGAHAYTTKAYGREVNRGGFLIYIGMPAFFVDTTDTWLAPKRARVAVSAAGPISELILGGLCSLFMALFPESPANPFLFKFAFFFYLGAFLNLNPLLELDGYYILIDWLEIPMLRARSFAFIQGPLWRKLWRRQRLSRQEWVFAVYGLAAILYLAFAIVVVLYFWQAHLSDMLSAMWASGTWWKQVVAAGILLGVAIPLAYVALVKLTEGVRAVVRALLRFRILIEPGRLAAFLIVSALLLMAPSYFGWTAGWDWHYRMGLHVVLLGGAAFVMIVGPRLGFAPAAAWLHWAAILVILVGIQWTDYGIIGPEPGPAFAGLVTLGQAGAGPLSVDREVTNELVRRHAVGLILCNIGVLLCVFGFTTATPRIPRGKPSRFLKFPIRLAGFLYVAGALIAAGWLLSVLPELERTWDTFRLLDVARYGWIVFLVVFVIMAMSINDTRFELGHLLLVFATLSLWLAYHSMNMAAPQGSTRSLAHYLRHAGRYEMLGFLLVVGAFVHFIVQEGRLPWRKHEPLKCPLDRETDRITAAFRYLAVNLAASYSCLMGRWRAEAILAKAEQVADVTIRPPTEDLPAPSGSVVALGRRYEEAMETIWRNMRWVVGARRLSRWIDLLLEHVPWQQREAATRYFAGKLDVQGLWEQAFATRKARYLHVLEQNPILADLDDEEKELAAGHLNYEQYHDGQAIIRQGDVGETFYLIERGQVEVLVADPDGRERSVALLGEGDYFGEIALLKRVPRTASCVARGKVGVLSLSADDFQQVVARHFEALGKVDRATTRAGTLMRIPLFRELDGAQIRAILHGISVQDFQDGDAIIRQGEIGDRFYVIADGQVRVLVADDEEAGRRGEGKEVARLGPGEYFGEIALLADVPRTASVTAIGPVELLTLSKKDFEAVMDANLGMQKHLEQVSSGRRLDTIRKRRRDEAVGG